MGVCVGAMLLLAGAAHIFAGESRAAVVAAVDSSRIAAYLNQPPDERGARQKQAELLAKQAQDSNNGPERRLLLSAAAAIDPAHTQHWLACAEFELEMGYSAAAETSLAAARISIKFKRGKERRAAVRDYSLAMGWWYFDAGRWQKSLSWGQRAVKYDAGLSGQLLVGLNSAYSLKSFDQVKTVCQVFKPIHSGGNRRMDMSWCYLVHFYFHKFPFDEPDILYWADRSTHHPNHDVMRWRDFGLDCEAHHAANAARTYYEKSARSVSARAGRWLTRRDQTIPTLTTPLAAMPFWTNLDDGYVTGSLAAYLGFAQAQMAAAGNTAERSRWAEKILANYGRTVRRCPDYPWVILWRSEALMVLEQMAEAKTEIQYARGSFRLHKYDEPDVDRVQGHLLLQERKWGLAAPMITAAVAAFPENATCWADLGLVEIYQGDTGAAHQALDRALELDPELAATWYNRGLLTLREGDPDAALPDLGRAAQLAPDDPRISKDLARVRQLAADAKGR